MEKVKNTFRKIINFVNKNINWFKAVFIGFMIIFVIYEATHIISEVNGTQMRAAFATQTPVTLCILAILGFAAVLPMLIYDFTIVEFLPGKFKPGYIIESGWITNTFTNIAGFGGFLGASLRATFYSKNATKKQVLYAISKIALFLLAGLSTYCLVSLVMIFGFGIGSQFSGYWIWLVGGGLYFPLVFLFTRLSNLDFFDDLTLPREIKLIIGSCLEWGSCALLFIIIGWFMKLPINLWAVFPIFMISNVIGVVSLLPGGLGTFDTTMIVGLSLLGVSPSAATVWVLLYRVFYYFLPFFVGCALFVHQMGHKVNEFLDDIPKTILHRSAQLIITAFMYFSGIMMILYATVPNLVLFNSIYLSLAPYTLYFLGQLSNIIIGFLLIGLAIGVGARVKKAFWPTVVILLFAIGNTLWKENFPIGVVIFLGFILLCLWLAKPGMYRERLTFSWGGIIFGVLIFGGALLMYLITGLYKSNHHFPIKFTNAYLLPSQQVWLTGFLGIVIAFVILFMLAVYLTYPTPKLAWLNQPFDGSRAHKVIDTFGGNEVSHLVFLRDKFVYFYSEDGVDQVFFMYKKKANKLIVMGEPVGNQDKLDAAIDQFMTDADIADYSLVFYEVGEKLTLLLHEKGFDFIKAGEEGHVDLDTFTLAGKRHRGERALMHKLEREGYVFEVLQPPFSKPFMSHLKTISDEWLEGREEKGFSLGFFDPYYLNQAPIAVMRDKNGKSIAFANIMPTGNKVMTSIDLMRSADEAPSGVMDGIFVNLFEYSKDEGYRWFNLGMAPLSNVGESKFSFVNEKIAHLIYQYGDAFYSFQGLRSYKEKYVDSWVSKYFVYRKDNSLIFTMLQLLSVVSERPATKAIEEDI